MIVTKNTLLLFLFSILTVCSVYGQSEKRKEMHDQFMQKLKENEIPKKYKQFCKVNKGDGNYKDAIFFRTQYGWALNNVKQLEKDIPLLLELKKDNPNFVYMKIFDPQRFPVSEWARFNDIATTLLEKFKNQKQAYKQVLIIRSFLGWMLHKYDQSENDFEELLSIEDKESPLYDKMVDFYCNVLVVNGEYEKAKTVIKEAFERSKDEYTINRLMHVYDVSESYEEVLNLTANIGIDSSSHWGFLLGKAFFKTGDTISADAYFKRYVSEIEFEGEIPVVRNEFSTRYLTPDALSILGDYYIGQKSNRGCFYYRLAIKALEPKEIEKDLEKKSKLAMVDEKDIEKYNELKEKDIEKQKMVKKELEQKIKDYCD